MLKQLIASLIAALHLAGPAALPDVGHPPKPPSEQVAGIIVVFDGHTGQVLDLRAFPFLTLDACKKYMDEHVPADGPNWTFEWDCLISPSSQEG